MKSFHQHLILLAVAFLFSGMVGGLLQKSIMHVDNSVPADSALVKSPDVMQEDGYFRLVLSEETGHSMVPVWRHVQW